MKIAALRAIRFYQDYLSPHKGFSCAYRVHTGQESCSAYGYRVIERFGLQKGWRLLRRRMRACARVACDCRSAQPAAAMPRQRATQAGYCDVPSCDLPACDIGMPSCDSELAGSVLDAASCGCDGCDLIDGCGSRRKKSDKESYVKVLPTP